MDTEAVVGRRAPSCRGCLPKNLAESVFSRAPAGTCPWSVHGEVELDGHLDERRLAAALAAVDAEHPVLRMTTCPDEADHWRCHPDPRSPLVVEQVEQVAGTTDDDAGRARDAALRQPVDITAQVLRVHLQRGGAGDRVVGVGHHAAIDGVGLNRVLADLARLYREGAGGAPPPVAVDRAWSDARDLSVPGVTPDHVTSVKQSLRRVMHDTPVQIAPDRPAGTSAAGVASAHVPLPPGVRHDVGRLVTAVALTVHAWNLGRGAAAAPVVIGLPINLRPASSWADGVCNVSLLWPVLVPVTDDRGVAEAAVADQVAAVRLGRRSRAVRGILGGLAGAGRLPVWAMRAMACTTVVSPVRGLATALDFGPGAPAVRDVWGSPPTSSAAGIAFGAGLDDDHAWLSSRYLLERFTPDGVDDLLGTVVERYVDTATRGTR